MFSDIFLSFCVAVISVKVNGALTYSSNNVVAIVATVANFILV